MGARQLRRGPRTNDKSYQSFEQLDGQHPWMRAVPDGFVPYRVRNLNCGEVTYFNFVLAKEMGLIAEDHPHTMNENLKKKILDTFSIQIINEYDEKTGTKFDQSSIKPNKYMASRYLQLQHPSKKGTTSGDGRGIWNGCIENRGTTWDVSSRGTGVTCLAPGAVEANRPLKTGGGQFGYGCGLAEIDELYSAAIMAEMMHIYGINTERVLCIIDLGKGYGIGVRAAHNLMRPAHLFLYLKQNRLEELRAGVDYLIDRQIRNKQWKAISRSKYKYLDMAEEICRNFARFTATLDIDYIFAWLDWDGDNVLADAGIIDYGSVRQFGMRHDRYRYDDVERFSTNLNEQRTKARLLVQVFVQIAEYISTGKKKPLKEFSKHPIVQKFNQHFRTFRAQRLLYRMGFSEVQRQNILSQKFELFDSFEKEFAYFERAKVSGALKKVADGINHPALFNMRNILRTLPEFYFGNNSLSNMPEEQFFKHILSSFAKQKDARLSRKHIQHIQNFQRLYKELLVTAGGKTRTQHVLKGVSERARILNREDRITGNALIQIVDELIAETKKGMSSKEVQALIDQIVFAHLNIPEVKLSRFYPRSPRLVVRPELYSRILGVVVDHNEDI